MAGHSKWANIMHRKGAQDKRRAQQFTKLAREIQAAVKLGGADPDTNARLFRAVQAARAASMPKDNIQRAVDRGSGNGAEELEEIRYEGFGPGGVGIIVECLTDNRNRTAGDVRSAFSKNGGNLGTSNAVTSGFDRLGEVRYPLSAADENAMLEAAIEAGADDCQTEEGEHVIVCPMGDLAEVAKALASHFGDPLSAKFVWRPHSTVTVEGDPAAQLMKLLTTLEDLDDVQTVSANFEMTEAEMERLGA